MRRVRDLQPYVGRRSKPRSSSWTRNPQTTWSCPGAPGSSRPQSEVRHTFLNTLSKGQIRKGVVSSIVNFGAFVDLGGVDGLVHVSELSGSTSTTRVRSSRSARRSPSRSSTWTWTASGVSLSLEVHPGRPVAAVRPDPPDRPGRTRPGHQAGCRSARFVRVEEGIEGPGPHLRAGRPPRGDPRAGRAGRATRSSSRSSTSTWTGAGSKPVAQAGQRGNRRRGRRRRLRPDPVRHARLVRRPGQLRVPRGLRPGRPASGCRATSGSARSGSTSTPKARGALRGAPAPGRGVPGQGRGGRTRWGSRPATARRPTAPRVAAAPAPPAARAGPALPGAVTSSSSPGAAATGTLASDEALAALREKLSGGQN